MENQERKYWVCLDEYWFYRTGEDVCFIVVGYDKPVCAIAEAPTFEKAERYSKGMNDWLNGYRMIKPSYAILR